MDMQTEIAGRLKTLGYERFEFEDESHRHIGHAGNKGGGHYSVVIISEAFRGISRLNRQRMVKSLLQDLFSDGLIHALSIKAVTSDEYFN